MNKLYQKIALCSSVLATVGMLGCEQRVNCEPNKEVKIKNDDPRLVEQCVYYPSQFDEKTRVITIAPSYSNKLYNTLSSLGYVEMKYYYIENNQLIIKDFKKIKYT